MVRTLEQAQLTELARGFSLLGSGGGGSTDLLELMIADAPLWPIDLYAPDDLDPDTPCLAAAYVGSTYLLTERIPDLDPFVSLIAAAERWTGVRAEAVCSLEAAGMNGLTPLLLAADRRIVDADFMGRALPRVDQVSLFADRVPGTVTVCSSGADGIVLVATDRAADVEHVVRSAVVQAGGVGPLVIAGFTVGELREHAILGNHSRALELGAAFEAAATAPLSELAVRLGGRMLGTGRVTGVEASPTDPHASTIEISDDRGEIFRIIGRSEFLAFMRNGVVEAATPEIIVTIDSISRDVLLVDGVTFSRHVAVIALPAPAWWMSTPERLRHVAPAAFGLDGLVPAA
ncbi:DUF917 domain-containing protein [Leifsonia sp. NPDC058292]|uniref:DUF917 domain-containing protein n=1 Tax=Leifsonia sp. NPDC058292 TaxID=3346428 RepID=UPI0036D8DC13